MLEIETIHMRIVSISTGNCLSSVVPESLLLVIFCI